MRTLDTFTRAEYGGSFSMSCSGFSCLVHTHLCMWAATNDGSIVALDPGTHACINEYKAHRDAVRCLCVLFDGEDEASVVSGSGMASAALLLPFTNTHTHTHM